MANKRKGQGLVEFALILPVILLLFCVIIESGRIFHAYTTVQHAAREGGRYAVTGQEMEGLGLNRVESIKHVARKATGSLMVEPGRYWAEGSPDAWPYYDQAGSLLIVVQGPDGVNTAGGPGEPVRVHVEHNMPIITPLLMPIAKYVRVVGEVEMINEGFGATGASHGGVPSGPLPTMPTSGPPPPASTATDTPGTPTDPPTETTTPTPSVTPTPTLIPLYLDKPIIVGDTQISGGGEPGQQVLIRDLQAREELGTVTIDGSGRFTLPFVIDASRLGHTIVALGYGQVDYAEVLGGTPTQTPTPTETPTPTPTVGPTATPTGAYIVLSSDCGDAGNKTITVYGYQWIYQNRNDDIIIRWDTDIEATVYADAQPISWVASINVDATEGNHTVSASNSRVGTVSAPYQVPCPEPTSTSTPTPTPASPDVVVDSVAPVGPIYAGLPAAFDVTVHNQSTAPINSMFWNDLFVDPPEPVSSASLFYELASGSPSDVDWSGISSLAPDASLTIRLTYYQGFETTGVHHVYALGDSIDQVDEGVLNEDNNHNGVEFTVLEPLETATPTPTATETPTPGGPTATETPAPGSISGATWIWVGSNWTVPQGRVVVKCWQGSTLVATTYSQDGYYLLTDIPVGTGYKVTGEIWIDGTRYYDERVNITVNSGQETRYVDLLLVPTTVEPTPTPTVTGTLTETPTGTSTSTSTPTEPVTPTDTATATPTELATPTDTSTPTPTEPPSNEVWLEAECGSVGSNFNILADGSASNGGYVQVQDGFNSTGSAPTGSDDRVRLTFNVDEAGAYIVWGRVIAPSGNDDSFWVRMDDGLTWYQWNNIPVGGTWHWDDVHDANNGNQTVTFNLSAGSHTLEFAYREDGTRLDKVYITNTGAIPSGMGGTAPGCSVPTWVQLAYDNFESGWGNYTDNGNETFLYTGGAYAHQGSNAANIQDDRDPQSSFELTNGLDLNAPGYTQLRIDFWFMMVDMEAGEDFWVQYSDDGGSNWQTIASFAQGGTYSNDAFYHVTVTIDEGALYTFSANAKIRFICHASGDWDDVYIDEIEIAAR